MLDNKNPRLFKKILLPALVLGSWLTGQAALAYISDLSADVAEPSFTPIAMDPLLTPAFEAPLAAHSLLTDIARAGDRFVAVGEHGNIIYSDDGGAQWQQARVPVSVNLTAVTFVDSQVGWAAGHHGVILKSEDAGASWALIFDGMDAGAQVIAAAEAEYEAAQAALDQAASEEDQEAALERLDLADLALGDARASIEFGPAQPLMDIWFESPQRGLAVGTYGQIFRTTDGGQSWVLGKHGIDNPYNFHYYGISEAANGDIYLVGEQGGIHLSSDRGATWTALDSPYEGSLYGVLNAAYGEDEVVLVYGFNGNVFRSTDRGQSWQQVQMPTRKSINDGVVLDDGSILLVGNSGVLLHSADGGETFSLQTDRLERPFVSVAVIGEDKLALVGIAGARIIQLGEGAVL